MDNIEDIGADTDSVQTRIFTSKLADFIAEEAPDMPASVIVGCLEYMKVYIILASTGDEE